MERNRMKLLIGMTACVVAATACLAQERVQDVARLQGQRTNQLMGYGLVVGLDGTGDGGKSQATVRALMAMHRRFHQPIVDPLELKANNSVALVAVTAQIPEFGAREGQPIDCIVTTVGEAKSIKGGELLVTPMQYAMFDAQRPETQAIFALAGGRVELIDPKQPTRGVIRGGAVLEADFIYSFIEDGAVTLVLNDVHAGWPMAHAVAQAINHELSRPGAARDGAARGQAGGDVAQVMGPKNVVVLLPDYEQENPALFIKRVLEAEIFEPPKAQARVTINRTDNSVVLEGNPVVSPTTIFVSGLGSVSIGKPPPDAPPANASTAAAKPAGGADAGKKLSGAAAVSLDEFLATLAQANVPPPQVVRAIENLHRSGALHAQLVYRE